MDACLYWYSPRNQCHFSGLPWIPTLPAKWPNNNNDNNDSAMWRLSFKTLGTVWKDSVTKNRGWEGGVHFCFCYFCLFVCFLLGGGAIDDHWGNIHIVHTSLASSPLPPSHPNPPNSLSPPPPPPQPTPLPLAASLSSLLQRCHGDQEMWEYRCPSEKESKREWRRRLRVWGGREGWKKGKEGGWAEDQWLNAHLKLV